MKRSSFAAQVEAALWAVQGGREATVDQVTEYLGLSTEIRRDRQRVAIALRDLSRAGRAEKMRPGVYRPVKREPGEPDKKEIMWRYLRARRVVSREDLEEAADAGTPTVKEFLASLEHLGLVVNEAGKGKPGRYRLVKDPVEMPVTDQAERQRQKRALKKQALAKLDTAWAAIAEARLAVSKLEEG